MADTFTYTHVTTAGLYSDTDGTALFGTPGNPTPGSGIAIAGSDGSNLQFISVDTSGKVNVNASISPPSDATNNGTIAFASATSVNVSTEGTSALMVNLTDSAGTYDGKVLFEVTLDGTNWLPINLYPAIPNGTPPVSSYTGTAPATPVTVNFTVPVGGIRQFRVIGDGTTGTAGTLTVYLTAGQGQYSVFNYSDNQANFLSTAYQGGTWNVGVTGTVAVTQSTTPWAVAPDNTVWTLTGTSANVNVTNTVTTTVSGTVDVNVTNASISVTQGTSPWVISGTVTANAGTGTFTVAGGLTNNNAAPAADNVGSLGYVATNAPETYTNGNQVLATTSLGGAVRIVPVDEENASLISYYSVDTAVAQKTLATATLTPIISIQTSSATTIYKLIHADGNSGGAIAQWQILKNPTLTGASFAAGPGNVNVDTSASAISAAGTVVWSGYSATADAVMDKLLVYMAAGATGDTFTLAAQKVGTGTCKVLGSLGWREQTAAL